VQAGFIQVGTDIWDVWGINEFHVHQRAAAEINAQRDLVLEKHGKYASHAEDQREAEEVPLFAQEIDVGIAKKFHFILTF
jgi:hypothetical protein